MGLDLELLVNGDLHTSWSYGGFATFRERLADAAGIPLREMVGFGGETSWAKFSNDGISGLLNHSDCDGFLYYSDAVQILPRLRELIGEWDADDIDRSRAEVLVEMLARIEDGDGHAVLFT